MAGATSALDVLARCQRHADGQEAPAAVLRLAGTDEFARQTVIQTIPPRLVALARRAHYMVGPGLAGWASEDELEQEIVITEGLTDALTARTRPISLISEVDVAHPTTTLELPAGFDDLNDWRQAAGHGFRTQLDHAIGEIGPVWESSRAWTGPATGHQQGAARLSDRTLPFNQTSVEARW